LPKPCQNTVPEAVLDQRRKAGSPESSIPAHLPVFLWLSLSISALPQTYNSGSGENISLESAEEGASFAVKGLLMPFITGSNVARRPRLICHPPSRHHCTTTTRPCPLLTFSSTPQRVLCAEAWRGEHDRPTHCTRSPASIHHRPQFRSILQNQSDWP